MQFNLFDRFLDAVVVLNAQMELKYANPAFAQICQVSERKLKKSPLLDEVIRLEHPLFSQKPFEISDEEASLYRETPFHLPSGGSNGTLQFCVQPFHDGEGTDYLILLRDVTLEKSLHDKYREQLGAKENVIIELRNAQNELKKYSENLEEMVQERTEELSAALNLQAATLDSLGQGFFVFKKDGDCLSYFSRVCPELLGRSPSGLKVWDVLQLKDQAKSQFASWIEVAFMGALPFREVVELVDVKELRVDGRSLKVEFFPMHDSNAELTGIVCVATDLTEHLLVQKQLDKERHFAEMITSVLKYPPQFKAFAQECDRVFENFAKDRMRASEELEILRALHTLKGGAASFSMKNFEESVAVLELYIKDKKESFSHITADPNFQTLLKKAARDYRFQRKVIVELIPFLEEDTQAIVFSREKFKRLIEDLEGDERFRSRALELKREHLFEPVINHIGNFRDELRRIAYELGKSIAPLQIEGGDLKIPPVELRRLLQSLVHLVRNAADHGIETADIRTELGKTELGQIHLSFKRIGEGLMISITDDGCGINTDRLREKLREMGRLEQAKLPAEQLHLLLLRGGISSRDSVGEFSGLGMGVSAVFEEVERLQGKMRVETSPAKGTEVTLEIPHIFGSPSTHQARRAA